VKFCTAIGGRAHEVVAAMLQPAHSWAQQEPPQATSRIRNGTAAQDVPMKFMPMISTPMPMPRRDHRVAMSSRMRIDATTAPTRHAIATTPVSGRSLRRVVARAPAKPGQHDVSDFAAAPRKKSGVASEILGGPPPPPELVRATGGMLQCQKSGSSE